MFNLCLAERNTHKSYEAMLSAAIKVQPTTNQVEPCCFLGFTPYDMRFFSSPLLFCWPEWSGIFQQQENIPALVAKTNTNSTDDCLPGVHFNTAAGVRGIPPSWLRVGQVFPIRSSRAETGQAVRITTLCWVDMVQLQGLDIKNIQ